MIEGFFLKSPRPSFIDKAGCTRQYESELSLRSFAQPFPSGDKGCANRPTRCYFFRKPTSPPLPLREGPPLISVFSPQGRRGNRPTRCSNRFAIRLADHQRSSPAAELRFFLCGDEPAFTQGLGCGLLDRYSMLAECSLDARCWLAACSILAACLMLDACRVLT